MSVIAASIDLEESSVGLELRELLAQPLGLGVLRVCAPLLEDVDRLQHTLPPPKTKGRAQSAVE